MICAPFYGEFGWEVALWAPHLRWLRKFHFANEEFRVWCWPGHEGLYADFASEVSPVWNPPDIRKRDCENAWFFPDGLYADPHAEVCRLMRSRRVTRSHVIHHKQMQVVWDPVPRCTRTVFHKFGEGVETQRGLVAFHARACAKKQPERNWGKGKWAALLTDLSRDTFLAIGTKADALCPEFPEHMKRDQPTDLRGSPVDRDIARLSECEFIIGPSSGPLHLANQCGVPAVWWSPNKKEVPRYRKTWNPFHVPNVQAGATWDPSVKEVFDAVAKMRAVLSGDGSR